MMWVNSDFNEPLSSLDTSPSRHLVTTMNTKWTKTDVPCDCGFLDRLADDPDLPVRFDEEMNEFHFIYSSSRGGEGHLLIHHCFFCGGKAPASRRPSFFRAISRAEQDRLWALLKPMKALADVVSAWGQPDQDLDPGTDVMTPEKDGEPGTIQRFRTLEYSHLSETAVVSVRVYPDDRVGFALHGKPADAEAA